MKLGISDIKKIASNREKENIDIELKSFDKLIRLDDKNRKDLACEIIAFANRNGGKIIFGIKDDGAFDNGDNIDVDKLKGKIHNICFDNISPVVETSTDYISEPEGTVLIVYVPRRKGMPHAFIEKRSGPELSSRIYYIRTSHGKKLVSDGQLQWLFQHTDEPKYNYDFRIGFEFDMQMQLFGGVVPWGNYEFTFFRELLTPDDKIAILKESKFTTLMNGLMPYLLLKSVAAFFKDSWHIGIRKGFDRMSSGAMITPTPLPSNSIYVHDIPVHGKSFVHELSWDFRGIVRDLVPCKIHMPPGTSIEIYYSAEKTSSTIIIKNEAFKIELITGMLSGGAGLHQKGVLHNLLFERYSVEVQQNSLAQYLHYDAAGHLSATFNYPEYDMDEFDNYLGYYNSLKEALDYFWNYDAKRKEHPSKEIIVIDDKLNEILELLRKNDK